MLAPLSVGRRFALASGANAANLFARVLEQLLLIPVLLTAWSVELFGEWLLIAAIPVYLALFDFGIVQSGSNELARRAGEEDEAGVKRFFAAYTAFFLRWSALLLAALIALVWLAPTAAWLGLERIDQAEAAWIFSLLIAGTLVSQNSLALIGGMRARRILASGLLVRAAGSLVRLALAFVAVSLFGWGPVAMAAILLATRLAEYAAEVLILARSDLAPTLNPMHRSDENMRRYLGSGLELMLFPLAQSLVLQGAVVVVGLTLGSAAVAIFATHRTLSRLTSQLAQLVVVPLRAEAGLLQKESDRETLSRLLVSASRMTLWAALACALGLFLAGPWLFGLWTDGKLGFLGELFGILVIATVLEAIWSVAASIRLGSNRHRPLAWGYAIASLFCIAGMLALAPYFGLKGVAASILLTELAMVFLTIPLTVAVLDMRAGAFGLALMRFPTREIARSLRYFAGAGRKST